LCVVAVLLNLLLLVSGKDSGYCGHHATYVFDDLGVLTISGNGSMFPFSDGLAPPWYSYRDYVKDVVVEGFINNIGEYSFSQCKSLASVTIGKYVEWIQEGAFKGCSNLKSVVIPAYVDSIGGSCFEDCTSLESVTMSSTLNSIGSDAFKGCTSLKSITIPRDCHVFSNNPFGNCPKLVVSVEKGNNYVTVENNTLLAVGNYWFLSYPATREDQSFTIPDSVGSIAENAFCGSKLVSLTINSKIITLLAGCFEGMDHLEKFSVADGNPTYQEIEGVLFENEAKLYKYPQNKNGTTYMVPEGVNTLDDYAFSGSINLESIDFSNSSVQVIGKYAFAGCANLKTLTIPKGVTDLREYTFKDSGITSLHLPAELSTIDEKALCGLSNLNEITLDEGNSVFKIEDGVLLSKDNEYVIKYPAGKNGSSYEIPDGGYKIYPCAFEGAKLEKVVIPKSMYYIGSEAFKGCTELKSMTIPANVYIQRSIGGDAFNGCSNLSHVEYLGAFDPDPYDSPFTDCPMLTHAWVGKHYKCDNNIFKRKHVFCQIPVKYRSGSSTVVPSVLLAITLVALFSFF